MLPPKFARADSAGTCKCSWSAGALVCVAEHGEECRARRIVKFRVAQALLTVPARVKSL